jgi:tRNA modification GTPase
MGITRTKQNIERADLVLFLSDDFNPSTQSEEATIIEHLPTTIPRLFVHNKIDLMDRNSCVEVREDGTHIYVSAKTGLGIEALKEEMLARIGWHSETGVFMARERHLVALTQSKIHLLTAHQQIHTFELLAEELRQAQVSLNQITGEFVADDLLGEIFSRFCIGK